MSVRPRLLLIDDDESVREALASTLDESGYAVTEAEGVVAALLVLSQQVPDAILLDIRLRDGDGIALLADVRARHPHVPVIMATAYGDSDRTILAMRAGAFDYVTKPFDFDVLLATVARAVRCPSVAKIETPAASGGFIGSSAGMREVWKAIGRAAASLAPVLVTGESGVGKELVARAIHQHGLRRHGKFVPVNLAALPMTLIESELFGHEKGAFTGASVRREGRFEVAQEGTLFLDEIGDLPMSLQTKLLRVLEDGGFERIGGTARLSSNTRIICATSKPVLPGTQGSTLREDLYYRLGVIRIDVPPLRMRRDDIPLLVDFFLRHTGSVARAVSESAMQSLLHYDWPGNVRQLRHVLENACIMSSADILDVDDLQLPKGAHAVAIPERGEDEEDLDLARNVARLERRLIERALQRSKGNRAQAARLLGIRRALLYARMKELGLHICSEEES